MTVKLYNSIVENSKISRLLKNKKILIIGGTGSWGSELVHQLITYYLPAEIRIFSRGEHKQVEMRQKYQDVKRLRFLIGDVRDALAVDQAMNNVDIVFNLSALKHVPVCEENVWEAIQTNVHGLHNVIVSAMKHKVDIVVQVSTDKAVNPLNLYGFTKGCAEKLITSANYSPIKPGHTKFVCVRGGNVLSTTGSVVPLFKYLIHKYNKVTLTSAKMSRYFMRVQQAIQLVLKATVEAKGGEIFVMKMPGVHITNLAEIMIKKLGNASTKIEKIGIRPGEKIYETLVSENESPRTVEDGNYFIILPERVFHDELYKHYQKFPPIKMKEYNSENTRQLDKNGILNLLEEDGWLKEKDTPFNSILSPYK